MIEIIASNWLGYQRIFMTPLRIAHTKFANVMQLGTPHSGVIHVRPFLNCVHILSLQALLRSDFEHWHSPAGSESNDSR